MAEQLIRKKSDTGAYIVKLLIGLFLMFGFSYVCPSWGGISQAGIAAIGIFAGVLFWILTGFGLIMPAIIGMFAVMCTGVYDAGSMIAATFGGSTIFQLIMVYAVCEGLSATGAGEFMAKWLISRPFVQGKPFLFTVIYLVACALAGAVVGMGGIVFMYNIQDYIRDYLDYPADSQWSKSMSLATFVSAQVGMALLPFKGMPFIIYAPMIAAMAAYGIEMNYAVYMICAVVITVAIVLMMVVFMKFFWKVDMSKLTDLDINSMEDMKNLRMTKPQLYCSLAFLLSILYSVALILIPKGTPVYNTLNGISQGVWFALVFAVMCIIRVDGKKIINADKVMANGVNWGVIMTVCAFTLVGNMISSPDLGIRTWINAMVGPVFSAMAFPMFMLILIVLCSFITNFMSNTALGMIMGTLAAPFIVDYVNSIGVNPTVIGCAITVACMYAFLTMSASGCSPLFLCRKEIESDAKFVWTKGLLVSLAGTLLMFVLFTLMAYLF